MSRVSDEINEYYGIGSMGSVARDILMHYGKGHKDGGHSGRYPWGSGENAEQRAADWLDRYKKYKSTGEYSDSDIAQILGCRSSTEMKAYLSIARNEKRAALISRVRSLKEAGHSQSEIARILGKNESSIRSMLDESRQAKMDEARNAYEFLKQRVDEAGMIDVTSDVVGTRPGPMNISKDKLKQALAMLKNDGYMVYSMNQKQVTNVGKYTHTDVLCPPGTEYRDIYQDPGKIGSVYDYFPVSGPDGKDIFKPTFVYPASLDSKRVQIKYAEEGGTDRDGLVEIRPGLKDINLNGSAFAQVRILVDGTHYIKGMAAYNDDLPPGIDIRFNTNKHVGTPMCGESSDNTVLKKIKKDPNNPFGALIKPIEKGGQYYYEDDQGEMQLNVVNKRQDQGDWSKWDKKLPSQFLVKQNKELIDKQLTETVQDKKKKLEEILSLTNPAVKQHLLDKFAEECETAAVTLSSNGFPNQRWHVILPVPSLKTDEIFAPNYPDGTILALVRYPHAGTFEIPIVRVNNKNGEALRMMGQNPVDAVGIHPDVASRLSGADFDGDTVMTIPCNTPGNPKITSTDPLPGLVGFDPKMQYPKIQGMKFMKYVDSEGKEHDNTQREMGEITNLICDMQIRGAPISDIEKAVKHSMVVIDAAKHELNYKQSEIDNEISRLKSTWQVHYDAEGKEHFGASTIITRADSEMEVTKRRGDPWINPNTGRIEWEGVDPRTGETKSKYVHETYVNKKGVEVERTQTEYRMLENRNPYEFISPVQHPKEILYANYARDMLALADQARKEYVAVPKLVFNKNASVTFASEVASLEAKLNDVIANAPRERLAQRIADSRIEAAKAAEQQSIGKKELKKLAQQALAAARALVGAKRPSIVFTDREWEAIQAGAIHHSKLATMLNYADDDDVRQRATPHSSTAISDAKASKIRAMMRSGRYTAAQIAAATGVSVSTVNKYGLNNEERTNE